MTEQYSLNIQNRSGDAQTVAVYQNINPSAGTPLIWLSKTINNKGNYTFSWQDTWELGWGNTPQGLDAGALYTSGGVPTEIQPNQANGKNELPITYVNQSFESQPAYYNSQLGLGNMLITTNTSFTVSDALQMSVGVYMNKQPILAAQGKPNSQYPFNTNTSYYLTVTEYPVGTAIPSFLQMQMLIVLIEAGSISQPQEVKFSSGSYEATYNLNSVLEFKKVNS